MVTEKQKIMDTLDYVEETIDEAVDNTLDYLEETSDKVRLKLRRLNGCIEEFDDISSINECILKVEEL